MWKAATSGTGGQLAEFPRVNQSVEICVHENILSIIILLIVLLSWLAVITRDIWENNHHHGLCLLGYVVIKQSLETYFIVIAAAVVAGIFIIRVFILTVLYISGPLATRNY